MAKDVIGFSMEDLERSPDSVLRLTDCVTCSEHHGEEIKYYCKYHSIPCCGTCFAKCHTTCWKVIDLEKELPDLLCISKREEIVAYLEQIEAHLMKFMIKNEDKIDNILPHINGSQVKIWEVKSKINFALSKMEEHVIDMESKLYKEVEKEKQDENRQCLSLLQAVRNSQQLLEAVHYHGNNAQKFLTMEKIRSQLLYYMNRVGEKYETIETVTITAELSSTIQSILSMSLPEFGKHVSSRGYNIIPFKGPFSQRNNFKVVGVFNVEAPTVKPPRYTDVTFLPDDRLLLVDDENRQCTLISSSYQFIASYQLTFNPWNVCALDNQQVAVSFDSVKFVHILSVDGDVIKPVRAITTRYNCNGIASAGKGEMVVNCYCGKLKSEWYLINIKGEVMHSHPYDCPNNEYNIYSHYVALNNAKTRVFISVHAMNSLLCFGIDGSRLFLYKPGNLLAPKGIAVDKHDNIYVSAKSSNSIHKLTPNFQILKVINERVPMFPQAICIHQSKDTIVVTNGLDSKTLYIYQPA
ncbi:hypothetical protein CHS0354_003503 [Potamilus streckersoni]|uniref:B box-type domain-containing protein n=1 Tax=Potamilus streckersoni TaxID=2493646 RepID=A0AAE0SZ27_9BIVA|nr:hypothetical protein CHS0354_003503 [Potamilus streckersoni]